MIREMKPVTQPELVVSIDTLRGVALGGVLLMNLLTMFRARLAGHLLGVDEPLGRGGALLLSLVRPLIEFKAFTLFSLLFGVGVAIQTERAAGRRARTAFLLRRFGALLIFGLVHLLFVWNGDILTLYAVCGLLLIPLLRLNASALAGLGLFLIGAPYIVQFPVPFPDHTTLLELAAGALHAYRTAGWHELFAFRSHETGLLIVPLLLLSLPRTLGLMLWGVVAWRCGLLAVNQRVWRWALIAGASIGFTGLILRKEQIATIPLTLAYAAAILLWKPHAPWLAAAGRMALTNYLIQSIVFGFAFYSYGLGWFARLGVAMTMVGGIVFYCVQLAWSRWWLGRFDFGPFEWLWRSISYLRWQPFMRENAGSVSRETIRVLLLATFLVVIPLIHLGVPLLLARVGPRWGWRGGYPGPVNLLGTLAIIAGVWLLVSILATTLHASRSLPPRVRLGLRPAQLLQAGPYARMRHPIYVAETCLWAGMIVLLGSPVAAAIFTCLAAVVSCWIIPREEMALEQQFGEAYRSYCTRVPSIPQFWRIR